jgi:hypothetical protein
LALCWRGRSHDFGCFSGCFVELMDYTHAGSSRAALSARHAGRGFRKVCALMKTCNLSLATVALGALAISYSACGAQGQDNTVPPSHNNGQAGSTSGSSAGSAGTPVTGSAGTPVTSGAGAPPTTFAGAFNTGAGGAVTSGGGTGKAGGTGTAGAATGGAGAPPVGGCTVAAGTIADLLIDDLEDGDNTIRPLGKRVGYWYTFNDGTTGAVQVPAPKDLFKGTAPGSTATPMFAAITSGPAFTKYGAGMGFDFNNTAAKSCPYNASAYTGIKFWAKANAGNMALMALTAMIKIPATTPSTSSSGTCTAMCEDHYSLKPAPVLTTTWTQYTITFASATTFGQNNFGTPVAFDKSKIIAMQFQVAKDFAFDFSVDDITFY